MPQALYIVLGVAMALASSYALGRLLFQYLRPRFYREEELLFSWLAGASLLHLLVFATLLTGTARKSVYVICTLALVGAAWKRGAWRLTSASRLPALPKPWRWLFWAVYLVYGFLYVSNAMAPEMSPDGSAYHLGLVGRYLRQHRFGGITTSMYANLTQGIELLFLYAYSMGRHSAAALVHCSFTLAMPWLMLNHARRFGYPLAGACAALLFFCSPVVGVDGTSAYIDIGAVAIVFAVFALLSIWREEPQPALVWLIGLLAGYTFAVKYTTALAIPFAGLWMLSTLWRSGKPWLRPMAVFSLLVAVMVLPWMIKNAVTVGNPLSPFFNRFFPNPHVFISFEEDYIQQMRRYGDIQGPLAIFLDLTLHGERLSGLLGPVFLLSPLALLSIRFAEGRRLLLAALVFGLPYANNIGTRFLLPAFPFLAMALAMAVARTPGVLPAMVLFHAVVSWPHMLRVTAPRAAWKLERIPVAGALRLTSEERFLTQRFGPYVVARMVEDFVPPGEKVFTFSGTAEAYTSRELVVAYQSGVGNNLGEHIWAAIFGEFGPSRHMTFRFAAQRARYLRVRQALGLSGEWGANEIRLYKGGSEVARKPAWQVRAWPNQWYAFFALDNNPATRWRPRQTATPGTFVELDLGEETEFDSVVVEMSRDYPVPALQLYAAMEPGQWRTVSEDAKEEEVTLVRGLRGAVMDEMRRQGIRYLLVAAGDPADEDYHVNGRLWGITKIAERGGVTLYRIEESRQ
ncbi:MAG: discoidin domain-containing protein [Bryobacterales bacterium]|nr:discoidin domain-containing protein [Bryobacterales bacterium]